MTNIPKKSALLTLACIGLAISPATAANLNYADGDLILYVQQFGGAMTAMFDLGPAYQFYRNATTNRINFINIGGTLTGTTGSGGAGYASNWYDDPNTFWGIAAANNASIATGQTNGDPNRTLYVSAVRNSVGTVGVSDSAQWGTISNTNMTIAATSIISMTGHLGSVPSGNTDRLVESGGTSAIPTTNPLIASGQAGSAFSNVFAGGVSRSFDIGTFGTFTGFGPGGTNIVAESALDLERILASNTTSGQVGGTLRKGDFEGTFVVTSAGDVSFLVAPVPEPCTVAILASSALVGLVRRRRIRHTVQKN